jgi:hypothetical protein
MDLNNHWTLIGIGIVFCIGGVYLFHRDAFEEEKSLLRPILVLIAGVALIGIGLAKMYGVME